LGQHYATMFFGLYDDAARRLTYVNCGHNPPFWIRADGTVQRLAATATVIGLFERWNCAVESIELEPTELLAVFSDGVSEAERGDEQFGEERLLQSLQELRGRPASAVVAAVFARVQEFSFFLAEFHLQIPRSGLRARAGVQRRVAVG
jgi:sigma-B regulation protein RsbU (phosphoserine phosphatase)